jgi:hypothetical protein
MRGCGSGTRVPPKAGESFSTGRAGIFSAIMTGERPPDVFTARFKPTLNKK